MIGQYYNYIYVDASCFRPESKGAWAVITDEEQYSGTIYKENINPQYCELVAIYQALMLSKDLIDQIVIFTDNNVAINLNKPVDVFEKRINKTGKGRLKNRSLIKKVYDLYNSLYHIEIRQISRNKNKIADQLAKKTLIQFVRGNNND